MSQRKGNYRRMSFKEPKKFFFIATEGKETEPRYFGIFKQKRESPIQVILVPNPYHKSAPLLVVKRLRSYLKNNAFNSSDEAWIVIDRDSFPEKVLDLVFAQAKKSKYSVAVSNPCFELWLYLHFKENKPFLDRDECQRELTKVLKGYSPDRKAEFSTESLLELVPKAIQRALALNSGTSDNSWPRCQCTQIYKLIQRLLPQAESQSKFPVAQSRPRDT